MARNLGSTNPVLGHRGFWRECSFWLRSTFDGSVPTDKIVYEKKPDGIFWADEVGDYVLSDTSVSAVTFDSQTVSLKTRDDISILRKKDLVSYQGKIWIVNGIRKHMIRQFHQVCNGLDLYEYVISLSR